LANRNSTKDYVVLDDVVDILPKIALDGKFRVYNIASGQNISTEEIAKTLAGMTGCRVEFLDTEPVRSPRTIDISRIQNEFGYRPQSVLDYAKTVITSGNIQ
jgi:nucleoside-diphosphate-sugar epimerase